MAKVEGPLHSISAHGSFGPRLTYSHRKSGQQVRFQKAQINARSAAQLSERALFEQARDLWLTLAPADKTAWNEYNAS